MTMSKSKIENDWLTIDEASHFLKLKKSSLYQKVNRREIPFYKPHGSKILRFSFQELNNWLQAGKREVLC